MQAIPEFFNTIGHLLTFAEVSNPNPRHISASGRQSLLCTSIRVRVGIRFRAVISAQAFDGGELFAMSHALRGAFCSNQ